MLFYHTYKYGEIELTFIVDLVINSLRLIILIIYSFEFCAIISSVSGGFIYSLPNLSYSPSCFCLISVVGTSQVMESSLQS